MDFAHSLCRLTGSVGLENELVVLENGARFGAPIRMRGPALLNG